MIRTKKLLAFWTTFFFITGIIVPANVFCLSVKEEEELSHEFLKVALTHYSVINDPLIVNYINHMGQKIVSTFPPQHFEYKFYVSESEVYNAFAGPGGHIFINSGLLEAMDGEDELAGILSHEISHVSCRHIAGMVERSKKIGWATLAGIAIGLFLGVGGSGEVASALTLGSVAAGKSASLSYSRENEMQADQVGLRYLNKAGYSAKGLLKILKKIRNKTWFGSDQIPTYLTTHPASEDRINVISTWIENGEKIGDIENKNSYPNFDRVHTRIVAAYSDKDIALKKFQARISKNPDDPMANYGLGLVLARTGNLKEATVYLKTSLEKNVFDPYILKDLGKIYFLEGNYSDALKILSSGIHYAPYDPERYFYLGRTQLKLGKYEEATDIFEQLIEKTPNYPDALHFLGKTYHELERPGDSSYYLGLHYHKKREYYNAVFHLKKALKNINDEEKKHEIKKLLKQIGKKRSHSRSETSSR